MHSLRVPGVYISEQRYSLAPLHIDKRCVAGFTGIAERGPLHTPVRLSGFDGYLKTFGSFDTLGNLPFAVYNFFKCGGSECVVVRTANEKQAGKAVIKLKCSSRGAVVFEALSEGIWGNHIAARVWHEGEAVAGTADIDSEWGAWIALNDMQAGANDVLRISVLGQVFYRTVIKKDGEQVFLDKPVPLLNKAKTQNKNIKIEKMFMSLSLSCKGATENYLHLSPNPDSERYFIDSINKRSALCRVTATSARGIIKPVFSKYAQGGGDGTAEMTAGDFIGGYNGPGLFRALGAFESIEDISLIAAPDASWLYSHPGVSEQEREQSVVAVYEAMIRQAERFPGRFAVLDVPGHFDSIKALSWAKRFDASCAAAYYPYIDALDPLDKTGSKTVRIPPSGAVCGCIAATDGQKGVFTAPANAVLHGAVGLAARITDSEHEMLYPAGINVLKYFPGRGVKIWGARTLSSDPAWRYINVRRTFSAICRSLKDGTQWAVFEANNRNLWKRVIRQVSGFLLDLWMKGYLAGGTPEQGFYVRCDEELNPQENADKGVLTVAVGLAITKPAEFFHIALTAEKDGVSVYINET